MSTSNTFMRKLESRLERLPVPTRLRRALFNVWTLATDVLRCNLPLQASAMAYVTLLSLIPSLAAVFCVLSLFTPLLAKGTNLLDVLRGAVLSNLASGAGQSVTDYLDHMLRGLNLSTLGVTAFASVLVTLILLLKQIEDAFNRIWLIKKARGTFRRFMYFWTFLTLGAVGAAIFIGSMSLKLSRWLQFTETATAIGGSGSTLGSIAARCLTWGAGFGFFFFLYKVVPNCFVRAKPAAVAAAFATVALNQSGRVYGMFVGSAKSYQTLYGALAQLPLFLTWIYICWIVILLGSLISWRLQEGFPEADADDTLDATATPLDELRNVQVRSVMPWFVLLTVYQEFSRGTRRGVSAQEMAHSLRLPAHWVGDALDALEQMGYVVPAKRSAQVAGDEPGTFGDAYYPALPAQAITLAQLQSDLARPMGDWMERWAHDLPVNLPTAVRIMNARVVDGGKDVTLADALAMVPAS